MSTASADALLLRLRALKVEPPANGFEQRLQAELRTQAALARLRTEPPARGFEQRLDERLAALAERPALRLLAGGAQGSSDSALSEAEGSATTPRVRRASFISVLPRRRGAWLLASVVLLAGGATASGTGLWGALAERVENVVKGFPSAPVSPPAPPAHVHVAETPRRASVAAAEPVLAAPRVAPAPAATTAEPVPRLELSAPPRPALGMPDRTLVERVRRAATRVSRGHEPVPRADRVSLTPEATRSAVPPRVERLRIEPEALRRERGAERLQASTRSLSGMREVARERQNQNRERPELRQGQDNGRTRQGPAPRPQRERGPREFSHPERPPR